MSGVSGCLVTLTTAFLTSEEEILIVEAYNYVRRQVQSKAAFMPDIYVLVYAVCNGNQTFSFFVYFSPPLIACFILNYLKSYLKLE